MEFIPTQAELDEVARLTDSSTCSVSSFCNAQKQIESRQLLMPESIQSNGILEAAQKHIAWGLQIALAA